MRGLCRLSWSSSAAKQRSLLPTTTCRGALTATRSLSCTASSHKSFYQRTLQLPVTSFELRAHAKSRDWLWRRRTTDTLYDWQRENLKDNEVWFTQDGPPYANGEIHMGHALNKILKDITNRYHLLKGKRIFYRPGWDVHGLPIEAKVLTNGELDRVKISLRDPLVLRKQAEAYADEQIREQKEEMRQLGIMTNWAEHYQTDHVDYEMRQLKVFAEIARKGLIYRARKPVHWSPWSQTALAEAEVEYDDTHFAHSLFVLFPFEASEDLLKKLPPAAQEAFLSEEVSALIWTTTPWSLPGNMAMAVNPNLSYSLVQMTDPTHPQERLRTFWVAADRIAWLSERKIGLTGPAGGKNRVLIGELQTLATVSGRDLLASKYRNPFQPFRSASRPIFDAPFVTKDTGTGLVHIAPGHGQEDFQLCISKGLISPSGPAAGQGFEEVLSPIDADGRFESEIATRQPILADLVGLHVLSRGQKHLIRYLWSNGFLLSEIPIQHKVPMDWRYHKALIVRATKQWFIDIDSLKAKAAKALDKVRFVPETSRSRLKNIVNARNEWCISRQRSWGVPIPVLYDAKTDEPLMTPENVDHIAKVLKQHGTSYWWSGSAEEFVAPQYKGQAKNGWVKGTDTMDVWFDSGVAWAASGSSPASRKEGDEVIADVYIEGTDQHRGWFQSSLLTKLAFDPEDAEPTAPYKTVATHGFVMDRKGQKMSKSIGNVITPRQVITGESVKKSRQPGLGTDALRMWSSKAVAWENDPRFSHLISKHASDDVRVFRTAARFLLGNLPAPEEIPSLDDAEVREGLDMHDRYILHEVRQLEKDVSKSYETFDFPSISRRSLEFYSKVLSPLYLDVVKDRLYSTNPASANRKACVAVMSQILDTTTSIFAPILPHLAEEIWHYRTKALRDPKEPDLDNAPSFFQGGWRGVDAQWEDAESHKRMQLVWQLRSAILKILDVVREKQWAKKREQVQLTIQLDESIDRSQLEASSQLLLNVIEQHTPSGKLADWLQLAQMNPIELVPRETLQGLTPETAGRGLTGQSTSWFQPGIFPLRYKNFQETEAPLRLIMRAADGANCPRCRISRAAVRNRACRPCKTVMDEMGIVTHFRDFGEGEEGDEDMEEDDEDEERERR